MKYKEGTILYATPNDLDELSEDADVYDWVATYAVTASGHAVPLYLGKEDIKDGKIAVSGIAEWMFPTAREAIESAIERDEAYSRKLAGYHEIARKQLQQKEQS
jgi:hypothetical protein